MSIGVVIVTHYRLGAEFLQALRLIVPDAPEFQSVSIDPGQSVEEMRGAIDPALSSADQGQGVLVLTDMFGGTPSNLAISILEEANIEVIAGVNLPLLVKLAGVRKSSDMSLAVAEACDAGRKYIKLASNELDFSNA